jgi:hypothetical protein
MNKKNKMNKDNDKAAAIGGHVVFGMACRCRGGA